MEKLSQKELLDAGVHFGHLKKKWNPKMLPYIFMERKGIHIIDLNKTSEKLEEAAQAAKSIAKSGRKILFVATKKQAKDLVRHKLTGIGSLKDCSGPLCGGRFNATICFPSLQLLQSTSAREPNWILVRSSWRS